MPIFDYKCPKCGAIIKDNLVPNSEYVVNCYTCYERMERMFPDHTSFSLKGKGWASDNYSKPKPIPPVGDSD